jgi:hypothetical protein
LFIVAKNSNNFKKFGKLASLVKKIADKNPEFKEQIFNESESTSKNSWNKIQKWTSKNLFPTFKQLPLKDFTLKKVENAINDDVATKKKSKCGNVFAIPDSDLGIIDPFDLEKTLRELPNDTQIQIGLEGGDGLVNTKIDKIKDIPNIGNGNTTQGIRDMYPNIRNIVFFRLRKKGKKQGDRANCSYFIKAVFVGDDENDAIDINLTEDERERRVVKGINEKDLTPKQRKDRKTLKELLEKESRAKKSKAKKREFKTPDKVVGKKEDKNIEKKIADKKDNKAERIKEFRLAVKDLKELLKDGLITKKQFKKSFDKLNDNLEKGGLI